MELRVLQRPSDGELALAVSLAIAGGLMIDCGAVLAVLGFADLRSYRSG